MAQTFQEWVNSNKKRGVSSQELKDGFFQRYGVKLEDQDANADYDAFKSDFEAKQFVGPEQPQTPEKPTQVVAPTPTPEKPAEAVVERDTGTLRPGDPAAFEGEGFIKAGARYLLPKAFGIEEAVLGPDPEVVRYDRAKTQAEIAKFRTIKPDEYKFDPRQVARLPGMIAGVAKETAKLPLELAAQVPEAALRAAQLVTPVADMPESQIRQQVSPEVYRKDIAKGLTKAGEAITEGAMKAAQLVTPAADVGGKQLAPQITPADITPKAIDVAKRYLGEDPDEELRLYSKDIYTNMQEDVEEVLAGVTQATFTDIIPLLPSKERKDLAGYFYEGMERGEQLPGFLAAGGAIVAKSAGLIAQGEIGKGIRALYERPATFLLTIAPLAGKLPPAARTKLLKIYASPVYAPFFTAKLGVKGYSMLRDRLSKLPEGTTEAQVAQRFVDPLRQRTPEETARAERIYEEARATREKTRTTTERLAETARPEEAQAFPQTEAVITEQGVQILESIDPQFYRTGDPSLLTPRQLEYFKQRDMRVMGKRRPTSDVTKLSPKNLTLAEMREAGLFGGRLEGAFSLARDVLLQDANETARIAITETGPEAILRTRFEEWVDRSQAEIAKQQSKYELTYDEVDILDNDYKNLTAEKQLRLSQGAPKSQISKIDKKMVSNRTKRSKKMTAIGEALRRKRAAEQRYQQELPARQEKLQKAAERINQEMLEARQRLEQFDERLSPEVAERTLQERAGLKEGRTAVERQQIQEGRRFARGGERPAVITDEAIAFERPGLKRYELSGSNLAAVRAAVRTIVDRLKDLEPGKRRQRIVDAARRSPDGSPFSISVEQLSKTDITKTILDQLVKEPELTEARADQFFEQITREQAPGEVVRIPLEPEVIGEVKETFKPSFPEGLAGRNFQLSPEINRIMSEGVADIVDANYNVFLQDRAFYEGFANYLTNKYARSKARAEMRKAKASLLRLFQERAQQRQKGPFEIAQDRYLEGITAEQLKKDMAEYLVIPEKGKLDIMKQEIKDRVLFDVRNRAFRQSLADNIKQETAGMIREPKTGEFLGTEPSAVGVARDVIKRSGEDGGSVPFGVATPKDGFGAVIEQVKAQGGADNVVRVLETYEKPSPELARVIGADVYVSPTFNSSFTSIIKSFDTIGKVELGFNKIVAELKRGYTSRNLSSAKNNLLSNVLLYFLYYGAIDGSKLLLGVPGGLTRTVFRDVTGKPTTTMFGRAVDVVAEPFTPEGNQAFTRFVRKQPANKMEGVLFDSFRESGLIDNTNISNEVSLLNKGNLVTELVTDPLARRGVPGAQQVSTAIKKINVAQDAAYTFGDNYFKLLAARSEAGFAFKVLNEVLEPSVRGKEPITVTLRLSERLTVEIAKDAEGNFYRIERTAEGRPVGRKLSETALTRLVGKAASRTSLDKFVDYERIPGYLAWLRSTAPGGIVSLFSTWAYKMMDAPGKRGIVSHMLENETAIYKTTSPRVEAAINDVKVNRGAGKAAAGAIAKTQVDQEQDGDVRRMLSYNPTGLQLITYSTSELDPFTLVYRDTSATNFMGGSEAMARLLMGTGAFLADKFADDLSVQVGPVVNPKESSTWLDKESQVAMNEVRKLFSKYKSGRLITATDALKIANFAGNPVFDFFDMVVESDNNPYVDVPLFGLKTLQSMAIGGTGKYMMDSMFTNGVGREYIRQGKGGLFLRTLFANVYKREANYSYRSDAIERQRNLARDMINMTLGTSYRYSFVHKRIGNKDKGAFGRWVDEHKKNLDASLLRAQKLRLQSLAAAGYPDNHPAMKEAIRRFVLLKQASNEQHAAFKLRVFDAIERSGFYENLNKVK